MSLFLGSDDYIGRFNLLESIMVNRNFPTSFLLHCTVLLHIVAAVKSGLLTVVKVRITIASYFGNVTALIKQ